MKKQASVFVRFGFATLGIVLVLGAFSAATFAQGGNGSISGTVTDPKGLAVGDASVTVKNVDTGVSIPLQTTAAGTYVAPYIQPGNYEVTATKAGFEAATQKQIVLHVGDKLTIDLQLPLQGQTSTITVSTEAPLVETEKTEESQTVSENQVSGLPMVGRRWENFVLLTPAVTTDGTSGLSSFRGISGLYNGNMVDGANNTQAFFSEARGRAIIVTYVYSPDSVREFEVSSSNYSAEFGQAAGGIVNAVTRSGTNDLHGDLFYDLRYPSLNALDPVGESKGILTQTVKQQNHFGGSMGTPIIKDKLFFFTTYDGFRKVNPILYTSTQANAAFGPAGTLGAFVCPLTASAADCTNAKNFIANTLLGAFPRDLKQDVFLGKLDYQLNTSNHLSAVFNWQNWGEPDGYNTSATVNNGGVTQNGHGGTHERFFIADWTSNFSSNKVNDFKFAWGRDFEFDDTNGPGPSASLTNIAAYGETSALPRPAFPDEHRYQFSDNFSIAKNTHLMKFGVDVNLIHELLINLFQGDGNYSYTSTTAFDGCPGTGSANPANATFCRWLDDAVGANVGDGLTGKHWSSFGQVDDPITHVGKDDFYDKDFGAFFEDTWKVRPSVTLNLGVRYDLQHVPAPPQPNTHTALLSEYTSTLNNDKNNIQPRLGLAWQFAKDTVLRVSYGIFYGKTSNSTYYALRVENGIYQQSFTNCTTAPTSCGPAFPNVFFTPPGPAPAAPFAGALTPTVALPPGGISPTAAAVHGMTPDFVNPAAHEGEITIERQLPGRMSFSATYLMTRGIHLPASYDANVAPATSQVTYDVLSCPTCSTTALTSTVPFYTNRIDPASGLVDIQASVVNSWYNGLVLTLRKPMSHDLEFTFNYTYSHALDTGETAGSFGTFYGTDAILDPYNLKRDYGNSDLDQRHRFVGSLIWEPTYGKNLSSAFARQLASDWIASAIVTAASGQPDVDYIGTTSYSPPSTTGPTVTPVDGGATGAVISTNAAPTGGRAAWLPRNPVNLPNLYDLDVRVGRGFTIHEKYHFDFTIDAFNALNHALVTGLNTTGYTEAAPGSGNCAGHTNACMVPSATFGQYTTTSGTLYSARQLQIGAKFSF